MSRWRQFQSKFKIPGRSLNICTQLGKRHSVRGHVLGAKPEPFL